MADRLVVLKAMAMCAQGGSSHDCLTSERGSGGPCVGRAKPQCSRCSCSPRVRPARYYAREAASNAIPPTTAMTLLDAHLEQIALCAASIAELPYV